MNFVMLSLNIISDLAFADTFTDDFVSNLKHTFIPRCHADILRHEATVFASFMKMLSEQQQKLLLLQTPWHLEGDKKGLNSKETKENPS